jgi:hypothetical protein
MSNTDVVVASKALILKLPGQGVREVVLSDLLEGR